MSKRTNPASIRSQISSDLLSLIRVLQEDSSGVVVNPDVLTSSANQARRDSKNATWSYEVANLQLRVAVPQNVLPMQCGKWLDILVNLDIEGQCVDSGEDCITALVLNLEIATDTRENVCSWHFDRHIDDGNQQSNIGSEAHPRYHFQHGGHAMKPFSNSLGSTLLLPAPRLAFPPMDAILSLDFVLSNFSGECWQNLRDNPTYVRLLQSSQKKHWKPYINRIASWWSDSPKDKACVDLWPHLA